MIEQQEFDDGAIEMLRRVGKGKLLGALRALFEANAPARLGAIGAAAEAGDTKGAAAPAHSLKSSAGQLGAIGLQRLCGEIEHAAEESDWARVAKLLADAGPMLARTLEWLRTKADGREGSEWQISP